MTLDKAHLQTCDAFAEKTNCTLPETPKSHIKRLEAEVQHHKKAAEDQKQTRLNEHRRGNRLKRVLEAHKVCIKEAKVEAQHLRRDVGSYSYLCYSLETLSVT